MLLILNKLMLKNVTTPNRLYSIGAGKGREQRRGYEQSFETVRLLI